MARYKIRPRHGKYTKKRQITYTKKGYEMTFGSKKDAMRTIRWWHRHGGKTPLTIVKIKKKR